MVAAYEGTMKNEKDLFMFRISAATPETLPMARLVKYLDELVTLFGSREHVHFLKVKKGSAAPAILVDPQAEPKVRARLRLATSEDAPQDLARSVSSINRLLREDNSSGDLRTPGGAKIIVFPGNKNPLDEEAVVTEEAALDGLLVRLGGKDETAHATIEVEPGRWENVTLSRSLARELAPFLYGQEIRVFGKGKWRRSTEGEWSLAQFTAERFETIGAGDLLETLRRLSTLEGNSWNTVDEPLAVLRRLRGGAG